MPGSLRLTLNASFSRPWAFSALIKLQQRLGKEAFPLITQYYYPDFREMNFTPDYPIVAKV